MRREAILGQRGDVASGEILERCFVAEAAGEIAAVQFFLAEHGEIDPGLAQSLTSARSVRWLRSSKAPSPSHSSTSVSRFRARTGSARSAAQSSRPASGRPPGLSAARSSASASAALPGVAPSSSVWKRRRSMTASTCSIIIGHS